MAVHHVHRPGLGPDGLKGGTPEQRETRRVVGVVAAGVAVVALARKGPVVLHEPQPVARRRRRPDCHRHPSRCLGTGAAAGVRARRYHHVQWLQFGRRGQAAVARQIDVHLVTELPERARQRVHDIRQTTRLGEWLTLRSHHGDTHAAMVAGTPRLGW